MTLKVNGFIEIIQLLRRAEAVSVEEPLCNGDKVIAESSCKGENGLIGFIIRNGRHMFERYVPLPLHR